VRATDARLTDLEIRYSHLEWQYADLSESLELTAHPSGSQRSAPGGTRAIAVERMTPRAAFDFRSVV